MMPGMTDFLEKTPCRDCLAKPGSEHMPGCDVERCSACGGQRISCGCGNPHNPAKAKWTGVWPGVEEAVHLGLYCRERIKFEACGANDPGAMPDLNEVERLRLNRVDLTDAEAVAAFHAKHGRRP